jgi:DNA-binding transcriptional MerR regulator
MVSEKLAIGDLARRTGCKVQTIRYYEQIGLLPHPARTAGGQRRYGAAHLDRLLFIRHSRELGFSLDQIRSLLHLSDRPDRSCDDADRIARENLEAVRHRIRSLRVLEEELERMVAECRGGRVCDCRVIEVLSDHGKCLHDRHDTP